MVVYLAVLMSLFPSSWLNPFPELILTIFAIGCWVSRPIPNLAIWKIGYQLPTESTFREISPNRSRCFKGVSISLNPSFIFDADHSERQRAWWGDMVVVTLLSTYKTLCPDRSFQNLSKAIPQVGRKLMCMWLLSRSQNLSEWSILNIVCVVWR